MPGILSEKSTNYILWFHQASLQEYQRGKKS
jgi:hypothetical protein